MAKRSIRTLFAALILTTVAGAALAQGPLHKQLYFTINVPYKLRMGDYMLPSGYYTLRQVSANDLNLFWLFQGDTGHTPIAAIRTVRRDLSVKGYTSRTEMVWRMDEESSTPSIPVVKGFQIPGEDGWEIIAVVPRGEGHHILARVR